MTDITAALIAHPAHKPSIPPPAPPPFTFQSPSYFQGFALPEDAILVGDCHITRGAITLLTGMPGCGKSRLLMSLAIAGKLGKGASWMGLPVHAAFKTAILQAENGEVRLQREFDDISGQGHDLDGHLFITPPPPRGFAFDDAHFRSCLQEWLLQHRPAVLAIDPWNRAVADDKARDYRQIIDAIESCLPCGPDRPALLVVHHLRKSASGEGRKVGRELLNEIAGSYIIGSACRTAFVLEPATPDPADARVVFTCAKNNNGEMGEPTAWHRRNGLFEPCAEFDWKAWRQGGSTRSVIELEDVAAIFNHGQTTLLRSEAAKALQAATGAGHSAAYNALKPGGRFGDHLVEIGGVLSFMA